MLHWSLRAVKAAVCSVQTIILEKCAPRAMLGCGGPARDWCYLRTLVTAPGPAITAHAHLGQNGTLGDAGTWRSTPGQVTTLLETFCRSRRFGCQQVFQEILINVSCRWMFNALTIPGFKWVCLQKIYRFQGLKLKRLLLFVLVCNNFNI